MNDSAAIGIILVLSILIFMSFVVTRQTEKQTKLLQQQIEISQQMNQKLKILTLKGK